MSTSLHKLRSDFDEAFALPTQSHTPDTEDFLVVTAGALRVALSVGSLSAIHKGKDVVPLLSKARAFKGVVNLGRHLSSVYDLASVLGSTTDAPSASSQRWLAVLLHPAITLSFDTLERYVRVEKTPSLDCSGEQALTISCVLEPHGAVQLLQLPALARAIEDIAGGDNKKPESTE
jgi:hypothetical protein